MRSVRIVLVALLGFGLGCGRAASPAPVVPRSTAAVPPTAATRSPSWATESQRGVRDVLETHAATLASCTSKIGAHGSHDVVLDLRVAKDGRVRATRVVSADPATARAASCLAGRLRTISFAGANAGDVHVRVPLTVRTRSVTVGALVDVSYPSANRNAVARRNANGRPASSDGVAFGGATHDDAALVRASLAERRPAVERCYERTLRQAPNVRGTVTVEFTVAPDGEVDRVAVASNTTRHPGLARCITSVVGRFRFAPTGGAATYRYPYAFRPAS